MSKVSMLNLISFFFRKNSIAFFVIHTVKVQTDSTWEMFTGVNIYHYYICFLCKKKMFYYSSSYCMKFRLSTRAEKDLCKPPCGRMRFLFFFEQCLILMNRSLQKIPIFRFTQPHRSAVFWDLFSFLPGVLTNLASFLCCTSGISHQAIRGQSDAITIPQCHSR